MSVQISTLRLTLTLLSSLLVFGTKLQDKVSKLFVQFHKVCFKISEVFCI